MPAIRMAAERRDGRLFGRGAYDMKSGLAAMMVAAVRAASPGLRGDVLVACVADEEYASHGTEEVVRHFRADAAIVTEPTHLELTVAHQGLRLVRGGRAGPRGARLAARSRPRRDRQAGRFLVALEAWDRRLRAGPAHPRLGTGSVHASLIEGGQELSSYPALCRVSLERRTIPGETGASVAAELRAILAGLAAEDPEFRWELTPGLVRAPFEIAESEPIVQTLHRAATARLGHAPSWRAEPFWTDCAILAEAGIPALLFGASGGGAHAAEEWAEEASVEAAADILTTTIREFCA